MARDSLQCCKLSLLENGNICDASEIMITSDSIGNAMPDSFDAPQASTAEETPVNSCMETCCKTFVHTNSASISADKIYRK